MKWNTLQYLFKEGIVGLWKNRLMALASAGTIVLCLLILGMSYSIADNITHVLEQFELKLGITAYVDDSASEERIAKIQQGIQNMTNVVSVEYISKADALKIFTEDQGSEEAFKQFAEDNPLPASFEIQVSGVEMQGQVVEKLKTIPELEVTYFEKETNMFIKVNDSIKLISGVITGCLIIIGLLLINNTIKLTVYVRRREINIMKYIGATDWFIRLPFLIEGVIIGLIGSLISTAIVYEAYKWMLEFTQHNLANLLGGITLTPLSEIMGTLTFVFLLIGTGIGLLGSGIAIRKHLKV